MAQYVKLGVKASTDGEVYSCTALDIGEFPSGTDNNVGSTVNINNAPLPVIQEPNDLLTNKVVFNGETIIDLTEDTATAEDVAEGKIFHLASGLKAVGISTKKYDEDEYLAYGELKYEEGKASGGSASITTEDLPSGGQLVTIKT